MAREGAESSMASDAQVGVRRSAQTSDSMEGLPDSVERLANIYDNKSQRAQGLVGESSSHLVDLLQARSKGMAQEGERHHEEERDQNENRLGCVKHGKASPQPLIACPLLFILSQSLLHDPHAPLLTPWWPILQSLDLGHK